MGDNKTVEWWDEWCGKSKAEHGNSNGHGNSLAIETQRLLPTPSASDGSGGKTSRSGDRINEPLLGGIANLLPTPNAQDGNGGGRFSSAGHQSTLPGEIRLLPTPRTSDPRSHRRGDCESERNRHDPDIEAVTHHFPNDSWGRYAQAIHRWESLTRPPPPPTELNRNGKPRLNPAFSEWMMGWPDGWVTAVHGVSRNDQLKIIGNGVVPQQAVAALQWLLSIEAVSA